MHISGSFQNAFIFIDCCIRTADNCIPVLQDHRIIHTGIRRGFSLLRCSVCACRIINFAVPACGKAKNHYSRHQERKQLAYVFHKENLLYFDGLIVKEVS